MAADGISPVVIVHGGAGHFDAARQAAAEAACARAALAGAAVLSQGGCALDAVQAAVRVLEDDPVLNAGRGASLNAAGTVEVDAAIMDGDSRRLGAVAAMELCGRAIDVARAVLEDGRHSLLCGTGAWAFAREHGFAPDAPDDLILDYRRAQLAAKRGDGGGTVGACAVDARGRVAAATSTGGTTGKLPGRIGDTPVPGCGTFASRDAAASATGHGECILKTAMTKVVVDAARDGQDALAAARAGVAEVDRWAPGDAGVIVVDRRGGAGAAHNTREMPFAIARAGDAGARLVASDLRVPDDPDWR